MVKNLIWLILLTLSVQTLSQSDEWLKKVGIPKNDWTRAKVNYPKLEDIEKANQADEFAYNEINSQGYLEYRHQKTELLFILIPSGTFLMGTPLEENGKHPNESPIRRIYLDAYLMAKYELDNTCYLNFHLEIGKHEPKWLDSKQSIDIITGEDYYRKADAHLCSRPIVGISWDDAQAFCKWSGLELPTEAQWERACRANTNTAFFWGDDASKIEEYAWCCKNSEGKIHEVGQKKPNGFGLYDMAGNVSEWCQDWYSYEYDPKDVVNPKGPAKGFDRVFRGGSWSNYPEVTVYYCRSGGYRGAGNPKKTRFNTLGFRPSKSLYQ